MSKYCDDDSPEGSGGGMVISGDGILGVDVDGLYELAEELNKYATKMTGCLDRIFYVIDHLSDDSWDGEYYEAFANMCKNYRESLYLYVSFISLHAIAFKTAAQEGEQLITDVKNSCMRYSGGGGGGRSSYGGSGVQVSYAVVN